MQEPGRRPAPPFAGVDLRRPRGYPAPPAAAKAEEPASSASQTALAPALAGDPCPRCESRDTKFCYYNNYNTSQPRHFCKSCRRYWTKGGSLRNVPVGGGTRKGSSSASSSSPKSSKRSKSSKRRRVAPAPDASTTVTADDANTAPSPAPPTVATTTVAAAEKPTAPEPAATVAATETPTAPKPTATVAATEKPPAADPAATVAATEKPTAPPATVGGFTDMCPAPGVGLADVGSGGKELLPDPSQFEWPSGCDLGPYWGTSVFADNDPALFLNLP